MESNFKTIENDDYKLDIFNDVDAVNPLCEQETIGMHIYFKNAPNFLWQKIFNGYDEAADAFNTHVKLISTKYIYKDNGSFYMSNENKNTFIGVIFITEETFFSFTGCEYNGSDEHNSLINNQAKEELEKTVSFLNGETFMYELYKNAELCDEKNTFTTCDIVDPVKRKLWNFINASCCFYGKDMNKNGLFESVKTYLNEEEEFSKILV